MFGGKHEFHSMLDDEISELSKLKPFADDNAASTHVRGFFFRMVENFVGKGDNVVSHPFLFLRCF